MSSIRNQMLEQMQSSRDYRQGFVDEAIRSRIVGQITAMRKERGWDLKTFASQIGKKVSWAYRLEDPNAAPPTIPSLLEVAGAFDVGLDVRFKRYSELLNDATSLGPESFLVPSFDEEVAAGAFWKRNRGRSVRKKPKSRGRLKLHRGKTGPEVTERRPPLAETSGPHWANGANNNVGGFRVASGNLASGM